MAIPSAEELDSFKYSDLQNLAKRLGLRANLRADKLLKALKTHLKQEAKKENMNQDESRGLTLSCDETEVQINSEDHITKTRRRCQTAQGSPAFQQDHSEVSLSHLTKLQNQEGQENWDLRTTGKIPPLPDKSHGEEHAVSSGKNEINDFKKLHEAHFKEMESIDEYIKRRKKHHSSHEVKKQPGSQRGVMTPIPPGARRSATCTPASQLRSQGQAQGHAGQSDVSLKGSVKRSGLSVTKMNVRFSAATKDNEHKRSLTKTPARKSPHVTMSGNTPKGQVVFGTPTLKTTKGNSAAAVITPLKLTTMTMQTPVSNKKPVFDLKASLSRPLNYEPHRGKLKPWGQSKENNSLNEHVSRMNFRKKTYKQPPLQTREEQRRKHEQERKEKKAKVLGARRGLIMAKDR
ncbi:nucleolar and spindle-associated protein 1 isoform X3 [Fukomys damarensis]|uniref:nucleolar and spindle-associated protein 1 isoform X3 n=1 Tax=Fukomys damarensis TaxID=885580 RepID=UPI00053F448D|nr:nucleolar and spindle-associated protein 1 isoform X3 [Fukomys damarensis]